MNHLKVKGICLILAAATAFAIGEKDRALPYRAVTAHYVIETDVSDDFADEMGEFMEVMYNAYLKVFRNIQPNWEGRLRVRILKNREDYIKEVGEKYSWSAGVYRGRVAGILTCLGKGTTAGVKHVLQHEGFHQFFDKFIGGGATWVNEGLATYFGSGIIEGDKIRLGAVHPVTLKAVREAMDKGHALSLKDLLFITGSEWAENMSEKDKPPEYAQAMLLIHFLVHGYEGRNIPTLNNYLTLQKNRVYGEEALRRAFGTNFALFEKKWKEYVLQLKPYEPPSCTRNLERLATLLISAQNGPGVPADIESLRSLARQGKIHGWRITLYDGRTVTPTDADEIEKWFHCPEAKKPSEITYELKAPKPEMVFPDIVCRKHGRYLLRAEIQARPDGKGFYPVVVQERFSSRRK